MTALPQIADLPGSTPVALFPVRIETRYRPDGSGGTELCCRIYPATAELDTHEPELTADEAGTGAAYQRALTAATTADDRHAAWQTLCAQLGAPRAAWVAKATAAGAHDPGRRAGTWTRPAHAVVLPDFWVALGYRRGTRVFAVASEPVASDPLPAGPVPGRAGPSTATGITPLADKVAWLVDYDLAVAAGMAVTVPLGGGPLGLDRLVMLGAKGLSPEAGATRVAQLLDAQRYTTGAAVLVPGTPSNNTPQAPSGYSTSTDPTDPSGEQPTAESGDGSDGSRLAAALGLDPTGFTGLPGLNAQSSIAGQAINALLWPASWGQFLSSMISPAPDAESLDAVRRMFVDWVRPDGPLPALRLGSQPRAVLPVLPRSAFTDAKDPVAIVRLASLVNSLLIAWTGAGAQHGPDSAPATELLARTGVGWQVVARADIAVDRAGWYQHATAVMGVPEAAIDQLLQTQNDRLRGAEYLLGMSPGWVADHILLPGVADDVAAADGAAYPVADNGGPLKLSGASSSDTVLPDDYLNRLLAQDRAAMTVEGTPPSHDSLFYLLARHALLTAVTAEGAAADFPRPVPTLAARGGFGTTGDARSELTEAVAGAEHLAALPASALARLVAQTLDLTGNRLDPWATAFATRRLSQVRATAATAAGLLIGGWGVVENLTPAPALNAVSDPPVGETAGLLHDPANAGFSLAPSIGQATTSAVLRSGYLSYRPDDPGFALDPSGTPLEIDLSSRRVRLANYLLDGMREGQQLGALLGYRLERALHDGEVAANAYIAPFRALASLNATAGATAPDITDGLALSRLRHGPSGIPWGSQVGELVLGPEIQSVTRALDEVDETLDAVADALLAEAVHQSIQGHPDAARVAVDAASRGDLPPPELEFVRTPRSGFAVTHRVLVPWSAKPAATGGWTARPRADAEPAGSAWVASLLGNPARYAGALRYTDPSGAVPQATVAITLADLQLSPLDVVAGAAQPADFAAYALSAAVSAPAGMPVDAKVVLVIRPAGHGWTIADALAAAGAIGRLFGHARALDARDLTPPGTTASGADITDVTERYTAARAAVHDIVDRITVAYPAPGVIADRAALSKALVDAYLHGVPGAAPTPAGTSDATAGVHAGAVLAELNRRLDKAGPVADGADPQAVCEQLQTLFGAGFLTTVACTLPDPSSVSATIAATQTGGAETGQDLDSWWGRLALVRAPVAALENALSCAEALGTGPTLLLTVGQVPVVAGGARWVGLPLADGYSPAANTTSLVFAPGTVDVTTATTSMAGLVVDEWTEAIPATQEHVAAAFHFDAPGAQAPQTVVLAVPPPNPAAVWTLEDLETAVLETLDLVRARAADLDDQVALTPFLPAAYIGGSTAKWTDPSRFADLPPGFGTYDVANQPQLNTVTSAAGGAPSVEQGKTQTFTVGGTNLDQGSYSAGPDIVVTVTSANTGGAQLTVQAAAGAATGLRSLQVSNRGGTAVIDFTVTARPWVTAIAPSRIRQATAAGRARSTSVVNLTIRGQGLSGTSAVAITGDAVAVRSVRAVDDATVEVQVGVVDAEPYVSDWDPTQPGSPLKPPRRPAPQRTTVPLHVTVTIGNTVLDATVAGAPLFLDVVDYNTNP